MRAKYYVKSKRYISRLKHVRIHIARVYFNSSSDERNLMAKRFQNLYLLKCSMPFVETIQSTARWAFGNQRNRNSSAEKLRFRTGSWVFSGAFQSRASISMAGRVVVRHEKDGRRNRASHFIRIIGVSTQILWKKISSQKYFYSK